MAPPSESHNGQAEPLLSSKHSSDRQGDSPSATTSGVIKAFSTARVIFGTSTLIAPQWTFGIFQFPIPASMALLGRVFGIRELALGELLYTAEDKNSPTRGTREIKRALWAGIACDTVDLGAVALALATGTMGRVPAALFVGAAVAQLGLGAVALRGL